MANIRRNTSYGVGTPGESDFDAGCCEWCADNQQGNAIKYPPVGCDDSMCSNPAICPNYKGQYGQITSRPVLNPYPMQSPEEWSNAEGDEYGSTGIHCDDILGGCPTDNPIGNMPAPKTDYKAGDVISKQFDTICGPYLSVDTTESCARVRTTFKGTITGQVQLGKSAPKQYEVLWDPISGFADGITTYVLPHNVFPVSSIDDEDDEEITEIEIAEEEAGLITAGLTDNKVILYALLGVGAYLIFSNTEK